VSDNRPSLLIIGAAEESLGEALFTMASSNYDFASVHTAGINQEQIKLDVTHSLRISEVLMEVQPDILVCTVGVNRPHEVTAAYLPTIMGDSFMTNVVGPMEVLRHFVLSPVRKNRDHLIKKFVAVSSNSARIPRTRSMSYCASKAALSMALRVAARELAGGGVAVWGYEPGLLAGTPMTKQTAVDFPNAGGLLHRMKGVHPGGIPVTDLAHRILQDVATFSVAQNGLIIPFDGGEV
jgi:2,3-dihydro-2,3-dihydroxybenzoate dehydrogenase